MRENIEQSCGPPPVPGKPRTRRADNAAGPYSRLSVTESYQRDLPDLITGLNRWVLRVVAYAGPMADEYTPFRLDTGGADPADRP